MKFYIAARKPRATPVNHSFTMNDRGMHNGNSVQRIPQILGRFTMILRVTFEQSENRSCAGRRVQ
jgi:hypothetical protein